MFETIYPQKMSALRTLLEQHKNVYLPGVYYGEITDHGIAVESSGPSRFWLEFRPLARAASSDGIFLTKRGQERRIIFDGTISIGGHRRSRIALKARAAIQDHCKDPRGIVGASTDPYGLVGSELVCRCRHAKHKDGVKERWSVLD